METSKNIDIQNIIKAVDWLIFERVVKNRRDLAEKLGYTESSFSQIMNGKVGLSERFVKKLYNFDPRLNLNWLMTGKGDMINPVEDELQNKYISQEDDRQRSILEAIAAVQKIAESNRVLAESNHDLTMTNKILATSNTELVQKLAELMDEIRCMRSAPAYPPLGEPKGQVASDIHATYGKESK